MKAILKDTYDFNSGVRISSSKRKEWIQMSVDKLVENPNINEHLFASGNSIVIAIRRGEGYIHVMEIEGYIQHSYQLEP